MKKALIVKSERDYLVKQIGVARDSINLFSNTIIPLKDSIISNKSNQILIYKANEANYKEIINTKDKEINLYDNALKSAVTDKKIAYGVSAIMFAISLLVIL